MFFSGDLSCDLEMITPPGLSSPGGQGARLASPCSLQGSAKGPPTPHTGADRPVALGSVHWELDIWQKSSELRPCAQAWVGALERCKWGIRPQRGG